MTESTDLTRLPSTYFITDAGICLEQPQEGPWVRLTWSNTDTALQGDASIPSGSSGEDLNELARSMEMTSRLLYVANQMLEPLHHVEHALRHLSGLSPVRHIPAEREMRPTPSAYGIHMVGADRFSALDNFIPLHLRNFLHGNGSGNPAYAWAAPDADLSAFSTPYLMPWISGGVAGWRLLHVGDSWRSPVFGLGDANFAAWNDEEALTVLLTTVTEHDPEYAETVALLQDAALLDKAQGKFRQQTLVREAHAAFSRPRDRVKPRRVGEAVSEALQVWAEKWGNVPEIEDLRSWRSPMEWTTRELSLYLPTSARTNKIFHAGVAVVTARNATWRGGTLLENTNPKLYTSVFDDFAQVLASTITQEKLGQVVPFVLNGQRGLLVCANPGLVKEHAEALEVKGIEFAESCSL